MVSTRAEGAKLGRLEGSPNLQSATFSLLNFAQAAEALIVRPGTPAWLAEWRRAAWAAFERLPWPARDSEEWRRTDLSGYDFGTIGAYSDPGYRASSRSVLPKPLARRLQGGEDLGGMLVQHDSASVYHELTESLAQQGVIFCDLETAAREHAELVRKHLGSVVPLDDGKFPTLNAALWTGGVFLYVPRNRDIALPLRSLTWLAAVHGGIFPRTLIVAEPGSRVSYIEETLSGPSTESDDWALSNAVAEVVLGDGAEVRFLTLQEWGTHVAEFVTRRARAGRDARMRWVVAALGGQLSKADVDTRLEQPGGDSEIVGIVYGSGRQHFDQYTTQDHIAPHTHSDLLIKAALQDRARSVYQGMIHIHKAAVGANAYQTNRNLLLSKRARAESIPRLEIENNDVMCSHGAAVGPVDEDQMFYLTSRGLDEDTAERLIVEGFFEDVLERVPLASLREQVRGAIARKLDA